MKTIHIVLLCFLIVVLVFFSMLLYRACNYFQSPQVQAFSLIPDNVSLIIKGKSAEDILNFDKENAYFLSFLSSEKNRKRMNYIFSMLNNKQFAKNISLYLSLYNDASEDWTIILETSKNYNAVLLNFIDSLNVRFEEKSSVYRNNKIYAFFTDEGTLNLHHQNGLIVMTYSETRMRQAINKFENNKDTIETAISAIPAQRNENARIHIFVQYQYFIPFLKNKIKKTGGRTTELDVLKACQWSVFELNVKKQTILLSGYTTIDFSNNLSKLLTHKNNYLDIIKILPYNANHIFSIKANRAEDWKKIKSVVQMQEDFFALMYPNQVVTFDIENDTVVFHYLLIKSENCSEAAFHLYNSLQSSFENNHYILDTFYIGSQLVGHIDLPNFVFTKLGICNQLLRLKYYTFTNDYLIFTDKKEGILAYIEQFRHNKLLNKSENYQSSQNYFTNNANLFYYGNFSNRQIRMQLYAQSDSILLMNVLLE